MKYLSRRESSIVGVVFGVILLIIVLALSSTFRTLFLEVDMAVFRMFGSFDFFVPFMKVITFFGNWELVIPLVLVFFLFTYKKDKYYSIIILSVVIFTQGMVFLLKELFHRLRPPIGYLVESGFSFPSGHTTTSLVFYLLLAYFIYYNYNSNFRIVLSSALVLLAFLICLSRLVLNVHWFSDVILGFFIALSVIVIALSSYNELKG